MNALDLIQHSINYTGIAAASYSRALATDLFVECDDYAENGHVQEYWGATIDEDDVRHDWRVHLYGCP